MFLIKFSVRQPLMSKFTQINFKAVHISSVLWRANPCWLVNKAYVSCQRSSLSVLSVSCRGFETESVKSVVSVSHQAQWVSVCNFLANVHVTMCVVLSKSTERQVGGADASSRWRRHGVRVHVSLRRSDECWRVSW